MDTVMSAGWLRPVLIVGILVVAVNDPRPFQTQLTQFESQLERDQARLDNAPLDLQRYQTLVRTDAVPRQQLDTQVSLVQQLER